MLENKPVLCFTRSELQLDPNHELFIVAPHIKRREKGERSMQTRGLPILFILMMTRMKSESTHVYVKMVKPDFCVCSVLVIM